MKSPSTVEDEDDLSEDGTVIPAALEHLICENLWDFAIEDAFPPLANLRVLRFSFDDDFEYPGRDCEPVEDILDLLSEAKAPLLQRLHLGLPALEFRKRDYRADLERAFESFIKYSSLLEEVQLQHVIPMNVHAHCLSLSNTLRDLVLIGDVLSEAFVQVCLPSTLPNLQNLDLSGTTFNRRHTLRMQQEFVNRWRAASGVSFKPPSAFRDTIYRKHAAAAAT